MPDAVKSPCTDKCALDERNICTGCLRTLEEIIVWGGADDALKRKILSRVKERKEKQGKGRKK